MKSWQIGAIIFLVVMIGVGWFFFWAKNRPVVINDIAAPPVPTLAADRIAQGKGLYAQYCASCHGANLEGAPEWKEGPVNGSYPPPPHDSSGHTWHHKDDVLIRIVTNGGDPKYNSKMPAFKDQLTNAEIEATLDFIKSKWGKSEREFQWWLTAVGDQQ